MIAMHDEVHHHLCKSYRSGKFADSWMDFNADQLNTRRRDADGSELDNAKEVEKKNTRGTWRNCAVATALAFFQLFKSFRE